MEKRCIEHQTAHTPLVNGTGVQLRTGMRVQGKSLETLLVRLSAAAI